jgi:hypothetical protein
VRAVRFASSLPACGYRVYMDVLIAFGITAVNRRMETIRVLSRVKVFLRAKLPCAAPETGRRGGKIGEFVQHDVSIAAVAIARQRRSRGGCDDHREFGVFAGWPVRNLCAGC